jgi:hypothetical protein
MKNNNSSNMMSGMGVASKVESAKAPKTYFEKLREAK